MTNKMEKNVNIEVEATEEEVTVEETKKENLFARGFRWSKEHKKDIAKVVGAAVFVVTCVGLYKLGSKAAAENCSEMALEVVPDVTELVEEVVETAVEEVQ